MNECNNNTGSQTHYDSVSGTSLNQVNAYTREKFRYLGEEIRGMVDEFERYQRLLGVGDKIGKKIEDIYLPGSEKEGSKLGIDDMGIIREKIGEISSILRVLVMEIRTRYQGISEREGQEILLIQEQKNWINSILSLQQENPSFYIFLKSFEQNYQKGSFTSFEDFLIWYAKDIEQQNDTNKQMNDELGKDNVLEQMKESGEKVNHILTEKENDVSLSIDEIISLNVFNETLKELFEDKNFREIEKNVKELCENGLDKKILILHEIKELIGKINTHFTELRYFIDTFGMNDNKTVLYRRHLKLLMKQMEGYQKYLDKIVEKKLYYTHRVLA